MQFTLRCKALIWPADDLPGQWVSWCPELGNISQGDNPEEAFRMIVDSVLIISRDMLCPEWIEARGLHGRIQHPYRNGFHWIGTEPGEAEEMMAQHKNWKMHVVDMYGKPHLEYIHRPAVVRFDIDVETGCGIPFFQIPYVLSIHEMP